MPARRSAPTWAASCKTSIRRRSPACTPPAAGSRCITYLCPEKPHTHVGYGLDDPLDRDLAPGQPVRNDTYFANLIWDPSSHFRLAGEFTYRKTAYTLVPNNQGVGFQTQLQFKF